MQGDRNKLGQGKTFAANDSKNGEHTQIWQKWTDKEKRELITKGNKGKGKSSLGKGGGLEHQDYAAAAVSGQEFMLSDQQSSWLQPCKVLSSVWAQPSLTALVFSSSPIYCTDFLLFLTTRSIHLLSYLLFSSNHVSVFWTSLDALRENEWIIS